MITATVTRPAKPDHETGSHVLDFIQASMSARFSRKSLPDLPIAYATNSPAFTAARIESTDCFAYSDASFWFSHGVSVTTHRLK